MKVSEAIDRLKVGDTVWVKGEVNYTNKEVNYTNKAELLSICCDLATTSFWICDDDEISLTKPQAEKVEVPDFVAEWYESNKYKLERAIIDVACSMEKGELPYNLPFEDWFIDPENHPIETLISMMKDGYTVKSKRWVVRQGGSEVWYLQGFRNSLDGDIVKQWCSHEGCIKFTDKSKAEAVATLVEGSVEEV